MSSLVENGPFSANAPITKITRSGPHSIKPEQREIHKKVRMLVNDILPLTDQYKISDDDIIMRHCIAKQWKEKDAVASLKEYAKWRSESAVNKCSTLQYKLSVKDQLHGYFGHDREGYPVYFDQPNPTELSKLVKEEKREDLINWHLVVAEMGRKMAKESKSDRITCVMDLKHVGMGIVGNPKAMSLLKECSSIDQHKYPENMRVMCIINAPRSFKIIWKTVSTFLEQRVRDKIRVVATFEELDKVVPVENVPTEFGGTATGFLKVHQALDKQKEDEEKARVAAAAAAKERQLRMEREAEEEAEREDLDVESEEEEEESSHRDRSSPHTPFRREREPAEDTQAFSEESSLPSGAASPLFPKADNVMTPNGYTSPGSMSPTLGASFTSALQEGMRSQNNSFPSPPGPTVTTKRTRRTPQQRDAQSLWRPVRGLAPRPLPLVCTLMQKQPRTRRRCWTQCVIHIDDAWEHFEVHPFCGTGGTSPSTQNMTSSLKSVAPIHFESCPELKDQLEAEIGMLDVAFLRIAFFEGSLILVVDDAEERDVWVDWFWCSYPLCRPRQPQLVSLEAGLCEESLERGIIDAIPCHGS